MKSLTYDELPTNIKLIVNTFDDSVDGYKECERIIQELEAKGYTADYGLDAVLFDFRKLESEYKQII